MKTSGFLPRWVLVAILIVMLIPGSVFAVFPCHVTSTDHNCVSNGSVTLVAPTNSPVVCLGDSVSISAAVTIVNSRNQTVTHYDKCPDKVTDGGDAPTYGVTWTATVGSSWSTNGTGLIGRQTTRGKT